MQEEIRVQRLVIVDKDDNSRGQFFADGGGNVGIVLQDTEGNTRGTLALMGNGLIGLSLSHQDGTTRATFGLKNSVPVLEFLGKDGNSRLTLASHDHGTSIEIKDKIGNKRLGIEFDEEGMAGIVMRDSTQNRFVNLGISNAGFASLTLDGDHIKGGVSLSSDPIGDASVAFQDSNEITRAVVRSTHDGIGQLTFLDGSNNSRFSVYCAQNSVTLSLCDQQGQDRIAMLASNDAGANVGILDADGKERASMCVDSLGTPSVTLSDNNGQIRMLFMLPENDDPFIQLSDSSGRSVSLDR